MGLETGRERSLPRRRIMVRRMARTNAIIVFLALAALSMASSASAGKGVVAVLGQGDAQLSDEAGEFAFAAGIALNEATGDVYVVDADCCDLTTGGQRISQFSASGEFIRAWGWGVATGTAALETCTVTCRAGVSGAGNGQFALAVSVTNMAGVVPPQIAVDQADGSVYVADNLNNRIQKFSASGAYLGQFNGLDSPEGPFNLPQGVAVDPVSGDVYVADTNNNRVQRFDASGAYQSQIGTAGGGSGDGAFLGPTRVAVDSAGRLYVLDSGNGRVQRFTAAGIFDGVFASGAFSGPVDLTVDPADDHVYVAATSLDFSVQGIFEFDPDGVAIDTHAGNIPIVGATGGMAVRSATGRIYASSPFSPKGVLVLDEIDSPTVFIGPVSNVTDDGATFSGTVNSQGPPNTNYRFEYSTDGATWVRVPSADVAIGSGTTGVQVNRSVTGLDPNTAYRVRLVATEDFNAASATSAEAEFSTDAPPPSVQALGVGARTASTAWLGGRVNPQNSASSSYVEYTLASDTAYATSRRVPTAPDTVAVGSGNEFVTVAQLATGLEPDRTYRYRVVAMNVAGTTLGPDRTFTTPVELPGPPLGRGYEMVSPLDKNGGDVDRNLLSVFYSTSGAAASGNAVSYASQAQFAGISSGSPHSQYLSVRGDKGWSTRGISPPIKADPAIAILLPSVWFLSDDLSHAVFGTSARMTPEAGLLGDTHGLYLQRNTASASSYRLLSVPSSPLPIVPGSAGSRFSFAGATKDMNRVVLQGDLRPLTADAPEHGTAVYEWVNGQVRLVSRLPSGVPAASASAGRPGSEAAQFYPGDHVISEDGQRIFFSVGTAAAVPLYVREGGTVTTAVSASERAGGDPTVAQDATFHAAKADDGSLALFTSRSPLTTDATAKDGACSLDGAFELCHDDLYLWNANASVGQRLTDLTTADPEGGGVMGIAGAADDLSRVYFVAGGDLAPGATRGQSNLYVWSASGGVRLVASPVERAVFSPARLDPVEKYRDARVTREGSRILFTSSARLTAADTGGHKQVYLYDFEADRLTCVSCDPEEGVSTGDSWLFFGPGSGTSAVPYRLPRNLSVDGEKAFFETAQGLVARDTNGRADVYQWSDGELSLISSGKGADGSAFIDASESGDDVFFTTRERLVGRDTDDQVDVYDARVGGGESNPVPASPCEGDRCQGAFAPRPALPQPGSEVGSGDLRELMRPSFSVGRVSPSGRRALARGRVASLVVRVNKAGRVMLRGTARVGRKVRLVIVASKRSSKAGRVRLSLRLSSPGRAQLARTGRLRVALHLRFSGVREAQGRSLTLVESSREGRTR